MRELTFEEGIARINKYRLPFSLPVTMTHIPSDPLEAAAVLRAAGYDRPPSRWTPKASKADLDTIASQATSPLHKALVDNMIVSLHRAQPGSALEWIGNHPSAADQAALERLPASEGKQEVLSLIEEWKESNE